MASMRDIKRRKESIQSTSQITKAMKLVATVTLQKAKSRAEASQPYFTRLYETVTNMLAKSERMDHPFLQGNTSTKKGVILITSNRGLAGGYNANVIKLITKGDFSPEDTVIYPCGRKGKEYLERVGYTTKGDYSEVINSPLYSDAVSLGEDVLRDFENGEIGEIYLAYTVFKNTVSHIPTLLKLLPINQEDFKAEEEVDANESLTMMNYEPAEEAALSMIIPKYVHSLIFGGLIQAVASENGARMQAMDSATNNAEEMIEDLALLYNRARQTSITQELTEIVAGASAIE